MSPYPHLSSALPNLASPAEAAELLGRHRKTVERQLRKGSLPGVKIDDRWYVNLDQLAEMMRDQRVSA